MRGLLGEPKKVPPAEDLLAARKDRHVQPFVESVTGSLDLISSSTRMPRPLASGAHVHLIDILAAALNSRKPFRIERVIGIGRQVPCALPP